VLSDAGTYAGDVWEILELIHGLRFMVVVEDKISTIGSPIGMIITKPEVHGSHLRARFQGVVEES